jgi:hypothetical protein
VSAATSWAGIWPVLLLAATGLHAGFQATVTLLVYPALAEVPAPQWERAHDRHSRRITPLVGVVYAAVVLGCVGAVVSDPTRATLWVAALASAAALLVTALRAAPLHGRLGSGRDQQLVGRLLAADRLRLGLALLAFGAALLAALVTT